MQDIKIKQSLDRAYKILEPWSNKHRFEYFSYFEVIRMVVKYCSDNKKIMDLGCGIGILPLSLKFLGYNVYGMDKHIFSNKQSPMFKIGEIEKLKKIWQDNDLKIIDRDVLDIPATDLQNNYDAVVNTAVIEHLKDPKQFLSNANLFLKSGGLIFTMSPNLAVLYKRLRFLWGRSPAWDVKSFFDIGEKFVGHWREYTMSELKQMHGWTGFKIIEEKNCNVFSLPADGNLRWIFHLFTRGLSLVVLNGREANIAAFRKI